MSNRLAEYMFKKPTNRKPEGSQVLSNY